MLALIYKDHVAEILGIESEFVGKVVHEFEQLEDGSYKVMLDGDELYFAFDEMLVIGILHYPEGYEELKHQKFLKKQKEKVGVH